MDVDRVLALADRFGVGIALYEDCTAAAADLRALVAERQAVLDILANYRLSDWIGDGRLSETATIEAVERALGVTDE